MCDLQSLIDRQLGNQYRFNYDSVLRRLVVQPEESFYGLQNSAGGAAFEQDPPIFACRFAEAAGYEHILALANEDGRVALQDTSKIVANTVLEGFQCHKNAVFDLAWMPGSMSFVTVSGDHTACLWDAAGGAPRCVLVFSSHSKSVKTAAFRPAEPAVFATGARDGHVLLWDARAPAAAAAAPVLLRPDNALINCHSSFTPKTPGSHSKRARVDNVRPTSITGLVFQDDLTLLSCGECDGNIKVWDLRKNYNIYKREPLPKHSIPYCGSSTKNGYTNLIIDDARVRLYASCMDNVIYCFNISTYNTLPEQRYIGHENSTFYIKAGLSPDGRYLVSGSSDKHAYIWNVKYSQPAARLAGHWAEVTCAAWCRRGPTQLVTCSDDARHKIWRVGLEQPPPGLELAGRAELVPPVAAPHWAALDSTPSALRRRRAATPHSHTNKRARVERGGGGGKTKRCLTDMMNAARDDGGGGGGGGVSQPKRLKLELAAAGTAGAGEERLLAAGCKRRLSQCGSPPRDWGYITPKDTCSFMTPTKNYERKICKKITPKKSPCIALMSPESPKTRVIPFSPPTKDLPNFVLTGEAPHLRLMSPAKKKQDTTDWLTRMVAAKRGRAPPAPPPAPPAPLSPRDNLAAAAAPRLRLRENAQDCDQN